MKLPGFGTFFNALDYITRHYKNYPGALKRAIHVIKQDGLHAFYKRIRFRLGQHAQNTLQSSSENSLHNETAIYQYNTPVFTDEIRLQIDAFSIKPLLSLIVICDTQDNLLIETTLNSIKQQWYQSYEICLFYHDETNSSIDAHIHSLAIDISKIHILNSLNLSQAYKLTKGEFICLINAGDEITTDALYEVINFINHTDADFIYSDEDQRSHLGGYTKPHFKPDFSPDMLLSYNYISKLSFIRKKLLKNIEINYFTITAVFEYDFYLKVLEQTQKVFHISKVLYHRQPKPFIDDKKDRQCEMEKQVIIDALSRRNIAAKVMNGIFPCTYRLHYFVTEYPLISIIIPFKDKPELLKKCIESICTKSTYPSFEIIAMNNNSIEPETFKLIKELENYSNKIKFYDYNMPFNFSAINNYAVKNHTQGKYLVLLNNDIEIISDDWLQEMLGFAQREDVGVVGSKLYYPDDTIQHAGVILGLGGVAGHAHKNLERHEPGYFYRPNLIQNLSAVTAACLMVSRKKYFEVGGLNEEKLIIAFNDVDFSLKLRQKGYLNIYTPFCEAYHHESVSRGGEDSPEKQQRFRNEVNYMLQNYADLLIHDPYYNVNLTLTAEDFSLKK